MVSLPTKKTRQQPTCYVIYLGPKRGRGKPFVAILKRMSDLIWYQSTLQELDCGPVSKIIFNHLFRAAGPYINYKACDIPHSKENKIFFLKYKVGSRLKKLLENTLTTVVSTSLGFF